MNASWKSTKDNRPSSEDEFKTAKIEISDFDTLNVCEVAKRGEYRES